MISGIVKISNLLSPQCMFNKGKLAIFVVHLSLVPFAA